MPKVDRPGVGKHVLLVGQMLAILISHRTSRMDQACGRVAFVARSWCGLWCPANISLKFEFCPL